MDRDRQGLFEPVLQQGTAPTQSYDINKLIYVAFFGGPLAVAALGTRNALWLRVERKWIYLLAGVALLMLIGKLVWVAMNPAVEQTRTVRYLFRGLAILLFFGYRWVMGPAYRQHEVLRGETLPLLKDGLIAVLVAGLVEFLLLTATVIAVQANA
ncbi:MAG: hypothetical protein ACOY93_03795 [Bacillota bacterium]